MLRPGMTAGDPPTDIEVRPAESAAVTTTGRELCTLRPRCPTTGRCSPHA